MREDIELERCQSGRSSTLGKRVYVTVPRVRIPLSPPEQNENQKQNENEISFSFSFLDTSLFILILLLFLFLKKNSELGPTTLFILILIVILFLSFSHPQRAILRIRMTIRMRMNRDLSYKNVMSYIKNLRFTASHVTFIFTATSLKSSPSTSPVTPSPQR